MHSFHLLKLDLLCRVMLEIQVVNHDLSYLLNVVRHSFHLLKLDLLCRVMLEIQVVNHDLSYLLNVVKHSFHLLLIMTCRKHFDLHCRVMLEIQVVKQDRKSTRLNSSHVASSYAVFCLKKKNINRD